MHNCGSGDDLDARILGLEKAVGTALFKGILREYGRVNQPKLIRDAAIKGKVLQMLESATRGLDRLEAVTQRLDPLAVLWHFRSRHPCGGRWRRT